MESSREQGMNRRDFLSAAAMGAAGVGLASLVGCAKANAAGIPEKWDRECDVVLIGSGSALTAASYSASQGLQTVVLEKAATAGGTTTTSGGKTYILMNNIQNPKDDRARCLAYLTACNPHEFATPKQIEAYLDEGPKMIDFLGKEVKIGFKSFKSALVPSISGFEDVHGVLGVPNKDDETKTAGGNFQNPQIDYIKKQGGEIMLSTPAKRLVTRQLEDGRQEVLGVIAEADGKEISIKARKGVIIGTGPYDWNRELCKQLLPYGGTHYTWAIDSCTGDGLLMALGAGARISQTNRGWGIMPEIYPIDAIKAGEKLPIYAQRSDFKEKILGGANQWMMTPGQVAPLVSRMGQRFYKEPGNYSTMAAWGGLDARQETGFEYRFLPYVFGIIDAAMAATQGYDKLNPVPGWLTKGNTFEELADASGIDKFNFVNTMARWQRDAANGGVDTEYGRKSIKALGAGPYYAVKVAQFFQTSVGGIDVNEKAEVIAATGGVISRLYASTTAAALGGIVYPSSGGSIGPGMTFGYVAGKEAAALENWE